MRPLNPENWPARKFQPRLVAPLIDRVRELLADAGDYGPNDRLGLMCNRDDLRELLRALESQNEAK